MKARNDYRINHSLVLSLVGYLVKTLLLCIWFVTVFYPFIRPKLLNCPQVLLRRITVNCFSSIKPLANLKFSALPTTINAFLLPGEFGISIMLADGQVGV